MENVGIVESHIEEKKGQISAKIFEIAPNLRSMVQLYNLKPPKDLRSRIDFYGLVCQVIQGILNLTGNTLDLFHILVEYFDSALKDPVIADSVFDAFLFQQRRLAFNTLLFREEDLPEFHRLYLEFRDKVNALSNSDPSAGKTMLFFDVLLPLEETLALSAKKIADE